MRLTMLTEVDVSLV